MLESGIKQLIHSCLIDYDENLCTALNRRDLRIKLLTQTVSELLSHLGLSAMKDKFIRALESII